MTSILARQGGITVDDVELAQWAADNSTDAENEDIVREFEVCLVAAKSESIYAAVRAPFLPRATVDCPEPAADHLDSQQYLGRHLQV